MNDTAMAVLKAKSDADLKMAHIAQQVLKAMTAGWEGEIMRTFVERGNDPDAMKELVARIAASRAIDPR